MTKKKAKLVTTNVKVETSAEYEPTSEPQLDANPQPTKVDASELTKEKAGQPSDTTDYKLIIGSVVVLALAVFVGGFLLISNQSRKRQVISQPPQVTNDNDSCKMKEYAHTTVKYIPNHVIECDSALHLVTSLGSNFPQYYLNESAFELLSEFYKDSSVYFLPVIGDGMCGKSTLTNQIMNGLTGNYGQTYFPVGARNEPTTLGLWASRCKIPFRGGNIVLLDTEGLRDRFYSFLIPAVTPLIASHVLYLNPGRVAQGGLIDNLDMEKTIVSFREEIVKLDKENFDFNPGKSILISRIQEDFKNNFLDDFNLRQNNFEILFQMEARDSDKKNFITQNSFPFMTDHNSTCYAKSSVDFMNHLFGHESKWKKHATTNIVKTVLSDYIAVYNSILHEAFDRKVRKMEDFKLIVKEALKNFATSLYKQKIRSLFTQISNSCDFTEMEIAYSNAYLFANEKKDRHQQEGELLSFSKSLVFENIKSCIDKTFGRIDFCDRYLIENKRSEIIDLIVKSGDFHQRNADLYNQVSKYTGESLCNCFVITEFGSDHQRLVLQCMLVTSYTKFHFLLTLVGILILVGSVMNIYEVNDKLLLKMKPDYFPLLRIAVVVLDLFALAWGILYFANSNEPFYFPGKHLN